MLGWCVGFMSLSAVHATPRAYLKELVAKLLKTLKVRVPRFTLDLSIMSGRYPTVVEFHRNVPQEEQ